MKYKPLVILCIIVLINIALLNAQDKEEWLDAETEHYKISSSAGKRVIDEYKDKLELLFKKFSEVFKFTGKITEKCSVLIYKDKESYQRAAGTTEYKAYYKFKDKKLYCYYNKDMFVDICHEATHQFFDIMFPKYEELPKWFNEGIATCFENSQITKGELQIDTLNVQIGQLRMKRIKKAIKDNTYIPLKKFINIERREFTKGEKEKLQLHYAEAYSFCHFLWNYPNDTGTKGKYANIVDKLIEGFKKGKDIKEVYKEAFVIDKKAIDFDELEKEWNKYISELKIPN